MTETAQSRTGVLIRLTDERWAHIVDEHCEFAGLRGEVLETISDAEYVVAGRYNELLAVRMLDSRRALVVVYRETSATDGFVITAFVTTRTSNLRRREQVWPPKT